ncbi:hypothetical protein DSO57_1029599 [Entomophthora muscae]|uniref:Uncharacterized protein n=1 Tax=Entomophthora muscae TaxID=34485 RepID=A0ACC2TNL7_9FUNG|nr:hypothetical protein DSO57_1029599 [Entomophthora muscae]
MTVDINETTPIIESEYYGRGLRDLRARLFYLSQSGVGLVTVLVLFYLWWGKYSLFLWHPTFMVLFFVFMTQAILSLQYATTRQEQASGIKRHQMFQAAALLSLASGFLVINHMKRASGQGLFKSFHGKLGLAIIVAALLAAAVGTTSLHFPQLYRSSVRAKKAQVPHRYAGYAIYVLVIINIVLGLELAFGFHDTSVGRIVYSGLAFTGLTMLGGLTPRRMRW